MSGINKIFKYILVLAMFSACQPTNVPREYLTPISRVQNTAYGSWVNVELNQATLITDKTTLEGELIARDNDSIFILVEDHKLIVIPEAHANRIILYTHKNQAGTYAALTGIFLLPSIIGAIAYASDDFSSGFLMLGIPVFIVGVILTAIEANGDGNLLIYPEKSTLFDIQKFARFPKELPDPINRNQLTLKKK